MQGPPIQHLQPFVPFTNVPVVSLSLFSNDRNIIRKNQWPHQKPKLKFYQVQAFVGVTPARLVTPQTKSVQHDQSRGSNSYAGNRVKIDLQNHCKNSTNPQYIFYANRQQLFSIVSLRCELFLHLLLIFTTLCPPPTNTNFHL